MNLNGHASMYHCAPFGTNRTYKRFSPVRVCMCMESRKLLKLSERTENTYIRFLPTCSFTLASRQYENVCDLKGVHFLQTDMNTEYKQIASYLYEAALIWKGVFFVQLDMNTEHVQNTSRQWEYACD